MSRSGKTVLRSGPWWDGREMGFGRMSLIGPRPVWAGSPPLSRLSVATVGQAMTFDDGKARRELGYERRVSRAAGLVELRRTDGVGCGSTGDQPRAAIVSNAVGFSQSSWSVPAARKRVGAATHSVVTEAVGAGASASNHHAT